MKFEGRGVGIASLAPRTLGDVGVDVQGFAHVVVDKLFDERRHKVVGDFGVGVGKDTWGINVFGHGVDAHPRHLVHPREFVLVIRLVLMEHDGQVEGVVDLLCSARFNDGELLRSGRVGDVLSVPSMGEGLGTVVAGRVLHREGGPNVAFVLPLRVDEDVKGRGLAQRRPGQSKFSGFVVGPTRIEVHRGGLVGPRGAVVSDVLVVGVVFEDKPVIGCEREGVSKTPIPGENRAALRGVEVNEQIGPFEGGFPIGPVPSEEQHGFVPGQAEVNTAAVGGHQRIGRPIRIITVHGDVFWGLSLNKTTKKRGKKYHHEEHGLRAHCISVA